KGANVGQTRSSNGCATKSKKTLSPKIKKERRDSFSDGLPDYNLADYSDNGEPGEDQTVVLVSKSTHIVKPSNDKAESLIVGINMSDKLRRQWSGSGMSSSKENSRSPSAVVERKRRYDAVGDDSESSTPSSRQ